MEGERRSYNKVGQVSRFEPLKTQDLMSSSLAKKCFQNVGCIGFCEQLQQVKYHAKLPSLFATNLRIDKVTIAGVSFTISTEAIDTTTWIPKSREFFFKRLNMDV